MKQTVFLTIRLDPEDIHIPAGTDERIEDEALRKVQSYIGEALYGASFDKKVLSAQAVVEIEVEGDLYEDLTAEEKHEMRDSEMRRL